MSENSDIVDRTVCKLTVFFEEPFWVGVVERTLKGKRTVTKVTFGAEPKDYEIAEFFQKHYYELRFSPAVRAVVKETIKNSKRMQREVKNQLQNTGIGTKSQQALKLQQEEMKTERKQKSREQKLEEAEQMFLLKQQKRKDKHRGH